MIKSRRFSLTGLIIVGVVGMMAGICEAQTTTRVSVDQQGGDPNEASFHAAISGDGRFVAFVSDASDLVANDTNGLIDVFVHDRQTGQTSRVSVATGGSQSDGDSLSPSLSADGRYVAFVSYASNLVSGDTNGNADVFVHDRQTGQTSRVSVAAGGTQGNGSSDYADISADGRYVAFDSLASNLVGGDTNADYDVFVHDRQTGQTSRVSVATGGSQGNGASEFGGLSADGRHVVFISDASNLVGNDTNSVGDVFVHDRQTGQTSRISVATGGNQANGASSYSTINADGRFVAFDSLASNLVGGDTNSAGDVFVHDRQTGQTSRVSVATGGSQGNGESDYATLSADGRYVAFNSEAGNLVGGDTNGVVDVFVHDRQTGQTSRVSVATGGGQGNGPSQFPAISANGNFVAFGSFASNLVTGDMNDVADIFLNVRGSVAGTAPTASDFNGDGKTDLIWRNARTGETAIWLMNGTTRSSSAFPGGVPLAWEIAGIGDVTGDGRADVIWRHATNGAVAVWEMNGTTITTTGFPGTVPTAWVIAGVGDVNGDGKADLIWRNTSTGETAIWLMNGTAIASAAFPGGVPLAWQIEGIGDVTGDGRADVIWRNTANGTVAVWVMNGTTVTTTGFPGTVPTAWMIAGVGDVSGDGKADLIWRNTSTGQMAIWLMDGTTRSSSAIPGTMALTWHIVLAGDVNGDGKADVVWRNAASGAVEVWLMNGLTIISNASLDNVPGDWEVQR